MAISAKTYLSETYKGLPGEGVPVGGTSGQVLSKTSNTDFDTEWSDVGGLVLMQQEVITTAVSAVDFDLPAEYSRFKLTLTGMSFTSTTTFQARLYVSTDGGSTFLTTSIYSYYLEGPSGYGDTGTILSNQSGSTFQLLIPYYGGASGSDRSCTYDLTVTNTSLSGGGFVNYDVGGVEGHWRANTATRPDAIRVYSAVDSFAGGTITLYAYKES